MTYSVNSGLDVATCDETQGITGVDSQATVDGLSPLPLSSLIIPDLETSHRLPEQ